MELTLQQFDAIATQCRDVFIKKTHDYGTSWRILRPSSLTDQLYIKAWRIRSIEEKGVQQVSDSVADEFLGLVNYSIIALIQNDLPENTPLELSLETVSALYDQQFAETRRLLQQKNHDYGEVWRELRVSSMTDLILSKLLRIRQIEDNRGQTIASEGVDANYRDIINYAIFALIKLS